MSIWSFALEATGLNLLLQNETTPVTLFVPLDSGILGCAGEPGAWPPGPGMPLPVLGRVGMRWRWLGGVGPPRSLQGTATFWRQRRRRSGPDRRPRLRWTACPVCVPVAWHASLWYRRETCPRQPWRQRPEGCRLVVGLGSAPDPSPALALTGPPKLALGLCPRPPALPAPLLGLQCPRHPSPLPSFHFPPTLSSSFHLPRPAGAVECGQEDTYWRGSLTSPESVGLLLLHWVNGTLALGQADDAEPVSSATLLSQVQGSSAWDLSLGRNGSDTAVVMQGGSSAGVEQSRDLLDTLETCSGSTIYVIAAPMVPTHTPNTDLNKIPGLQVRVLFLEVPIGWARVVVVVVGEGEEGGGGVPAHAGAGEREKERKETT